MRANGRGWNDLRSHGGRLMDCTFTRSGDGWKCTRCGFEYRGRLARHRCEKTPEPRRRHIATVNQQIDAAIADGSTLYTREQIDARLAICRRCQEFTGANCRTMNRSCRTRLFWFWALVGFKDRFPAECERWHT